MKIIQCLAAATLGLASLTAQATVYTYTGNAFDFDTIGLAPGHVTARFEFDFDNSPFAAWDWYNFKSWDMRAGSVHLSSAQNDVLLSRFSFDSAMNITGWYFGGHDSESLSDYTKAISSLSSDYSFYAPNQASDIVIVKNPLHSASIYGNQGSWSVSASVPEPTSLFLMVIGAAACAGLRNRHARAK
jgi:hypothetical protein